MLPAAPTMACSSSTYHGGEYWEPLCAFVVPEKLKFRSSFFPKSNKSVDLLETYRNSSRRRGLPKVVDADRVTTRAVAGAMTLLRSILVKSHASPIALTVLAYSKGVIFRDAISGSIAEYFYLKCL